ncbi:hypothetical protein D0Z07_0177 [Hyphodiscus hymeniophilus]|uniref:NACHT domain-containing protein n=1 Tax=Hyphodiscus hymeniophilus TaxID=353542 RepID=A0A9P6VRI7_9HELO|nr:hypothetical protein D0Z07_0177 [Hyphodiscus hymeniophilus]
MDALTALSLAGTIVQFVDFGRKILGDYQHFYDSASGALPVNEELELITRELFDVVIKLGRPLHHGNVAPSSEQLAEYQALQKLCASCREVADELLAVLNGIKVKGRRQAWNSFREAIKAAWTRKEVQALSGRLDAFWKAIETHIMLGLRTSTHLIAIQQSERFDDLDNQTRNILIALLDGKDVYAQNLRDQTMAVAQMLNRTEAVLQDQHDKTRALIVDAMNVSDVLAKATGEYDISTERKKAILLQKKDEDIKVIVGDRILERLWFQSMRSRQGEVVEAHRQTFAWLFRSGLQRPTEPGGSGFVHWLESGSGIYWINGKAGSGKSTLMRYICESEETRKRLLTWAGMTPLTMGIFFFWNSGTIEQRSQIGLLRSLLHDVLSRHTELIPIVMPSVWARTYSHEIRPSSYDTPEVLTMELLTKAFKALVKQDLVPMKLCLFIDGLDEYEGDPADLADLFIDLGTSDRVKACLSSRPMVAYEYAFKTSSIIRLQNLTFEDIRLYVDDKLHANRRYQQLALQESEEAPALVEEIVTKADGVFLWVKLVVKSILIGLGNRDEIVDLQRRLRELPSDLEALFRNMLIDRIDAFYQTKASMVFQMVRASRECNDVLERFGEMPVPLTLFALSLADDNDPHLAMTSPIRPFTELEVSIRSNTMEDKLKSRCAGLLEVQGTSGEIPNASRLDIAKAGGKLQYLHRTVKDYLEQPSVWSTITIKTESLAFDPNISLLKSCLLQMKAAHLQGKKIIPESIWRCVSLGLEYSRQVELSHNPAYVPLLEQLDLVMTYLLEQTGHTYTGHWSRHYHPFETRPFEWYDTTKAVAVEYGLCAYLEHCLSQSSNNACEKKGRPLLDYAVSQNRKQRYPISPEVISVLLRHRADPNLRWGILEKSTPWENALMYAYSVQYKLEVTNLGTQEFVKRKPRQSVVYDLLRILVAFIQHGADVNASFKITIGRDALNERRPVLFVVNEVFARWYPEESAEIQHLLRRKGASEEIVSDFRFYGLFAWNTVKSRIW